MTLLVAGGLFGEIGLDGRREVNDEFRKTVAGTGSYDTIVPKFKALVDERDPNLDYYARGTFTSHNLDFAEDVLSIADAGCRCLAYM